MATLTFTNNYTIGDTVDAAAGMPPGDLAYYMSYRTAFSSGSSSGFDSIEWNEWVSQVEEYQDIITDDRGSAEIQALLYLFMVSLMQDAIDDGRWADIVTNFNEIFSGETTEKSAWRAILTGAASGLGLGGLGGALIGAGAGAIVVAFKSSDEDGMTFTLTDSDTGDETDITLPTGVWEQISDDSTAIGGATRGWLCYMWGAIKKDGVLEPSDVSSGYST